MPQTLGRHQRRLLAAPQAPRVVTAEAPCPDRWTAVTRSPKGPHRLPPAQSTQCSVMLQCAQPMGQCRRLRSAGISSVTGTPSCDDVGYPSRLGFTVRAWLASTASVSITMQPSVIAAWSRRSGAIRPPPGCCHGCNFASVKPVSAGRSVLRAKRATVYHRDNMSAEPVDARSLKP